MAPSSHLNNQPITRLIRVSGDQINTSEALIKESVVGVYFSPIVLSDF